MHATLAEWLVADGQFPAPLAGAMLRHVGLRAMSWHVQPAAGTRPAPMRALTVEEAGRPDAYEISGVSGDRREVLVDAGSGLSRRVAVEFPLDGPAFQLLCSAAAPLGLAAGSRITVACTLHVVAEHEWEGFALPDVRADWRVAAVVAAPRLVGGVGDYVVDLVPHPSAAGRQSSGSAGPPLAWPPRDSRS